MNGDKIVLRVGGVPIEIPVYENEAATRRIVDRINERLKRIEEESNRIDTQMFALLASVSFAAELEESARLRSEDNREMLKALDRIATSLQQLIQNSAK